MHDFTLPEEMMRNLERKSGKVHPFDVIDATRTALIVIDMQAYFMQPGYMGEVPMAREIVPNINRLADAVRTNGGHIVWIKNSSNDTEESWSTYHRHFLTPENMKRRYQTLLEDDAGHALDPGLDIRESDLQVVKKRFSPFIEGSSDLAEQLETRGIDTLIIAGTATNICCETTARDAMMLNYKAIVASDATAAASDAIHAAALCAVYGTFADVQTVAEIIDAMRKSLDR